MLMEMPAPGRPGRAMKYRDYTVISIKLAQAFAEGCRMHTGINWDGYGKLLIEEI